MFAARARASLKPLIHGRHSSSLTRYCEIAAIWRGFSHGRFSDGEWSLNRLRLSGKGERIRLLNRTFHSSPQSHSSEFDVGVKTLKNALFRTLEDDFSELGSVEKDGNQNSVVKLLTMREPSQNTNGKKKKKKKKKKKTKKQDQASDSISKPMLLTEKPEVSWKTNGNGKSKTETHASSPARNVTDSNVLFSEPSKLSSSTRDDISKAQNIILPISEAKKETSSNGSNHPSPVVVIRIGNLNSKTTDSKIHSMCLSIGPLEGLARVNEDTVDVLFRAKNLEKADSILEKLNEATVDHSQWTAEIVPEAEEASIDEMGMTIRSCFQDFEKQLIMRGIIVKDLKILLHSVKHLENHPMAREGTNALECFQEA